MATAQPVVVPQSEYTARDGEIQALRAALTASNPRLFAARVHRTAVGDELPYRLFTPAAAPSAAGAKFPLLLLLHGAGGRGTDNLLQIQGMNACIGAGIWTLPEHQAAHPCYVLAPQCPPEPAAWTELGDWKLESRPHHPQPTPPLAQVMELLDQILTTQPVDLGRVYVLGPSMGGFGAWDLLVRQPGRFAAAVPVCGGLADGQAPKIAHVPVWIFHGAADDVVPVSLSRDDFAALTAAGAHPRYTEYQDGPHGIATYAWTEPGLIEWLFAQRLGH